MPSGIGDDFFQLESLWANYNMDLKQNQEVKFLDDGKRNWKEKKESNMLLSLAYSQIDQRKSERLKDCGNILTFKRYDDDTLKLHEMRSCRVRLCPICSWRRSLKVYHQVFKIMKHMEVSSKSKYNYIMLTLTIRSMEGKDLDNKIKAILQGWRRLTHCKPFKSAVLGWYRSMEITHDINPFVTRKMFIKRKKYYESRGISVGDDNPNYNTYHPHIHAILAVKRSYYNGRDYIASSRWAELWADAMGLDYIPSVDVRRCTLSDLGGMERTVAEVSKYAAKSCEYVVPDDWDLTMETVGILNNALSRKRLIAFGGDMRKCWQDLQMDDVENGDLIHIEDNNDSEGLYNIVKYMWHIGYRQYVEI